MKQAIKGSKYSAPSIDSLARMAECENALLCLALWSGGDCGGGGGQELDLHLALVYNSWKNNFIPLNSRPIELIIEVSHLPNKEYVLAPPGPEDSR